MANIDKNLEKDLKALNMKFVLFDDYMNENNKNPTEITIYDYSEGVDFKSFKLPKKKLVDIEWVLSKYNTEKTYQAFTENFKTVLEKAGIKHSLNVYPTTYGIGIFVLFGYRNQNNELKAQINQILDGLGIKYRNERSDAGYVFRYVISKEKNNIEKLKL